MKTAEIIIPKLPQEFFLTDLKQRGFRLKKGSVFYNENHFYIDLRIPIRLRGRESYLFINSKLVISNKNNETLIRLYANINKLILVVILVGAVPPILLSYMYDSVLLFFYSSVFIALFSFIFFALNIVKLSNAYSQKFKANANNQNFNISKGQPHKIDVMHKSLK